VTRRWIAAHGYRARPAGPWTRDKLRYMERYASAFMTAMAPKRRQGKWNHLVYIDLLAGPGKGIDRATRAEFDGSPLRALRVRPKFDRVYLGDARARNVTILRRRIATEDLQRVDIEVDDCNVRAEKIVGSLPSKTLGLAFIDPEGFEATFSMFRALARRPIDILLLFPSGIGIRRNLRAFVKQPSSPMDALWGGPEMARSSPGQAGGRPPPFCGRSGHSGSTLDSAFQREDDWNRIRISGRKRSVLSEYSQCADVSPSVLLAPFRWLADLEEHKKDRAYWPATAPRFLSISVGASGRVKVKVLPLPSSLSTQMRPPCASTTLRVMASPSPVPSMSRVALLFTR